MKQLIILFTLITGLAQASITFDPADLDHRVDAECVAAFDLLAQIDTAKKDSYIFLAEEIISKYQSSKQFDLAVETKLVKLEHKVNVIGRDVWADMAGPLIGMSC